MNRPRPARVKDLHKIIAVRAPEDYPPLSVRGQDPKMARLLSQDLAYSKGEMSAIHLYLYQSWILAETLPELSGLLARIARVEMHHMDTLGRLIRMLGGDPRFCAVQPNGSQYWIGGMIPYHRHPNRMLLANIAAERDAADIYASQARYAQDPGVAATLLRLAEDERLHHQIFERYFQETGQKG